MQDLLQQKEAECTQLAAQNIHLQIDNDKLHGEQKILSTCALSVAVLLISQLLSKTLLCCQITPLNQCLAG